MHFIVGLTKSKGFDAVVVVMDKLSKSGHFIFASASLNCKPIVKISVKEIIRLNGVTMSIVNDKDPTLSG